MKTTQKRSSRAFSYLRFSSAKQAKGSSLFRQAGADDWAKTKGIPLDTSLTLHDLGVSAWKGRNATVGCLGEFLHAIESGCVLPGDYLVIEKIDRLTRQKVRDALNLWCDIIEAGVTIVTLRDGQEYGKESLADNSRLLFPIIEMMQANQYSVNLSGMLRGSWRKRRAEAAKRKVCRVCPCWMTTTKDRAEFRLLPERVKVVRRLIRMASEGVGLLATCRQLNKEKVPGVTRRGDWYPSLVHTILTDTALYGTFQPMARDKDQPNRKVPAGDPIKGYYPVLLTEDEWHVLQGKLRQRRNWKGPRGKGVVNLFSGLVYEEPTGSPLWLQKKGSGHMGTCFVPKASIEGHQPYKFIRYSLFEQRFLALVEELDPSALQPKKGKRPDKLAGLQARYDGREALRQRLADALETADVATVAGKLAEVEAELEQLKAKIAEARAEAKDTPDLRQTQSIIRQLADAKPADVEAMRLRLKSHIGGLVERILLDRVQEEPGLTPMIRAEVQFRDGGVRTLRYLATGKDRGKSEKAMAEQLERFAEWQPS